MYDLDYCRYKRVGNMKRGTQVEVSFAGKLVSTPTDGVARVRVDGLPGWVAIVPVSCVSDPNQQCYWIKDGDRCLLKWGHTGKHQPE